MFWKRVDKSNTTQPLEGDYSSWKDLLADEGEHQCVYCTIDEDTFGGIRNYHVEHYRPKSDPRFKSLMNDIKNLFFACSICNGFKGNDWLDNESDPVGQIGYPDPSVIDYSDLFDVNLNDGMVSGKFQSSRYLTRKLYLNRPQLLSYRRYKAIDALRKETTSQLDKLVTELDSMSEKEESAWELLNAAYRSIRQVQDCIDQIAASTPYTTEQIRRV